MVVGGTSGFPISAWSEIPYVGNMSYLIPVFLSVFIQSIDRYI